MALKREILNIKGARLDGESPLPKFRARKPTFPNFLGEFPDEMKEGAGFHVKVLPYTMQDRYTRDRVPMSLKCVVLENKYLRCEFLPEYGGRLHRLYDKVRGQDLLFTNTVIQPCNLAIRNAWLSGGIEWNIGSLGHTFTTCDNIFMAELTDNEGNKFIRIYEFERLKSVFWQVDFHLPEDSSYLITHVKIINPFREPTTTYWWSNVAVPDNGKTRILASGDKVISFIEGDMKHEVLPHLDAMPGDISYPSVATRSFDFFIQPNYPEECTWEAAVYDNGVALYERSTPPLSCKKLYAWGVHLGGNHWQEFLSEEGRGYYAEIQAGIAPSQLHDKLIGAKSVYEWTQVFGGVSGAVDTLNGEYHEASEYLGAIIDEEITAEELMALDDKLKTLANMKVSADMLLHQGSGFGAIEGMRIERDNDGYVPTSMCFPLFTIGDKEYPWYSLINEGALPNPSPRSAPVTFMTSDKWLPHIKASIDNGKENWYSEYLYGVAIYDGVDNTKYATEAYSEEDECNRARLAEVAWLRSVELCPNYQAYRCLGVLESDRENLDEAEKYYSLAMLCDGAHDDFALLNEYLEILYKNGKYDIAFSEYERAPERLKSADRLKITVALSAVRLGTPEAIKFLERFFDEEHIVIREGENTLTDIWFEYVARRLARERGIALTDDKLDSLIDEAWEKYPPDIKHDFRQSYDRKLKYRV